jgi:hypothetical protein
MLCFPSIRRTGAVLMLAWALAGAAPAQAAVPSTFAPVIGSALLCRSHLDNRVFQQYLTKAFGPSYKHEGGAFWFRAPDAKLWGAEVTDVLISDDSSPLVFIAAVTNASADKLEQAVRGAVGVRHRAIDRSATPVRESSPGSKIVFFNTRSKIFCAKYKPLPLGR